MIKTLYMVFDVESVGLHGEGFAVGWVVVDDLGIERSHGLISCDPIVACGITDKSEHAAREWLSKNIPPLPVTHGSLREMRTDFWKQWLAWKVLGAILVADCAWPVEARFLGLCISDDADAREWEGPYPLHDLASVLLAAGIDPLTKFPRKENELPEHNPLNDARQSARVMLDVLVNNKSEFYRGIDAGLEAAGVIKNWMSNHYMAVKCKHCKSWNQDSGICNNANVSTQAEGLNVLSSSNGERPITGPDFGCIHHEQI